MVYGEHTKTQRYTYGLDVISLDTWHETANEWSQVSQNNHDETTYYVKDAQGSVRSLVNQKNQVRKTYNYDAFGRVVEKNHVNDQGIRSNIYHYGGYIYDYTTRMYFVNNRYYNPELGR